MPVVDLRLLEVGYRLKLIVYIGSAGKSRRACLQLVEKVRYIEISTTNSHMNTQKKQARDGTPAVKNFPYF